MPPAFSRLRCAHLAWLVVALTLALYLPHAGNRFVSLDDGLLIYENPVVQAMTIQTLWHIFTTYDPELYIPLTFFSYQLNHAIAGLNPFVFHGTNLALHIANVLLVVWIVSLLLHGRKGINGTEGTEVSEGKRNVGNVGNLGHLGNLPIPLLWGRAHVWALFVGLLFALHPLHTEAVVWAAARKDVLSAFLFLLSVIFYLLYRKKNSQASSLQLAPRGPRSEVRPPAPTSRSHVLYWSSVGMFLLALLSKVSVITLPFVLLLIDWYGGRRDWRRMVWEKAPYLGLAVLFGIIALGGKRENLGESGFLLNALLAAKSAVFYLQKLAWPLHLSVIYPQLTPVALSRPEFLIPVSVLILLALTAVLSARRAPVITLGILLYALLLVPNTMNFYKNGFLFFASDRYAYLPSVGIFLIVAWLASLLSRRRKVSDVSGVSEVTEGKRNVGNIGNVGNLGYLLGCAAITALFLGLSWRQARTWRDSEALYRNVLRVYPASAMAHNNLGDVLMKKGMREEAEVHFRESLRLDPRMVSAHLNMGDVYRERGEYTEAEEEFRRAIERIPQKPVLALDEVAPYYYLGALYEQMGRQEESLRQFRTAVRRSPGNAEPHYNLGIMLQKMGRRDEAEEELKQTIALEPRYLDAHYHLAALYAETGRIDLALGKLEIVLSLNPGHVKAREHLANMRRLKR